MSTEYDGLWSAETYQNKNQYKLQQLNQFCIAKYVSTQNQWNIDLYGTVLNELNVQVVYFVHTLARTCTTHICAEHSGLC